MTSAETGPQRLRVQIRGAVQGVGFRPFVYRLARELDLAGWVINSSSGVVIEVEGPPATLEQFLLRVVRDCPPRAIVQGTESAYFDAAGFRGFEIRESVGGEKTALVLPDIATCPNCLQDLGDPTNRRYRYPFTNCTNCGPRFSIIESLPYDRPNTTMAGFPMCEACRREYEDPGDRRFHAQPNACPACGPHVELWDADGRVLSTGDEALRAAEARITAGSIVAVKGLGGFHLVVDARDDTAVRRLRLAKAREEKPFALMAPSLASIERLCELGERERRLLTSPESPIVLLKARSAPVADAVAPSVAPGNPYLGVMLPYTPLHYLLLGDLGFPVVATSGNRSDEPIAPTSGRHSSGCAAWPTCSSCTTGRSPDTWTTRSCAWRPGANWCSAARGATRRCRSCWPLPGRRCWVSGRTSRTRWLSRSERTSSSASTSATWRRPRHLARSSGLSARSSGCTRPRRRRWPAISIPITCPRVTPDAAACRSGRCSTISRTC